MNPEADKLAKRLAKAAKAYYAGTPTMADELFDDLRANLAKMAPDHPFLKVVGAPVENTLAKHTLSTRMGSLSNAFGGDEIAAWVKSITALCKKQSLAVPKSAVGQPKLDGLSVQLSYRNGQLTVAATRGDGFTGEDVTANVRKARGVPMAIAEPCDIDVRGEMVILKDDFAKHFTGEANPRNSAAGTVRRKDGQRAEHLTFIAFDAQVVGENDDVSEMLRNEMSLIDRLTDWGFTAATTTQYNFDAETLTAAYNGFGERRSTLPYLVDGFVLKINGRRTAEALGWADTCPRAAIACKWKGSMTAEAEVVGIEHSVGHTGTITPVAIIKPTLCGGVTISNVNLMNWDEVRRIEDAGAGPSTLGLGSIIAIERAGEVIPRCVSVVKACHPNRVFGRPEACPSCGQQTVVDGPRQMCVNEACPAQAYRTIMRWVKGRNILHLGDETVDRLMAVAGPVQTVADLYTVTRDQMKQACGGYTMADKILASLEASRDCTPAQVFGNIGIGGIGETEAAKVCEYLDAIDIADVALAPVAAYKAAIGEVRGQKFAEGVVQNARLLAELGCLLRVKPAEKKSGGWSGLTFCCTGPTEIPRDRLIQILADAGGTWKSSVVNGLSYLITNDTDTGTKKNADALRKGVKILTEVEALRMAGYVE